MTLEPSLCLTYVLPMSYGSAIKNSIENSTAVITAIANALK